MFKREMKLNFKPFLIWVGIIVGLFVVAFAIYPSITSKGEDMAKLMETFPKEVLEMFNMDVIGIDTVFGWIATEGYIMMTILGGCYFAIMGSTILLKEEDEGSIAFLYSKPINRNQILTSKLLMGFIYIFLFNLVIAITTLIGLNLSNDFDFTKWLLISIAPIFLHLFFFTFTLLMSIYYRKTRKSMTMGIGVVLGTYMLQIIGMMSDKIEFVKYLSPFEYVSARDIVVDSSLKPINIGILLVMVVIILIGLYDSYNKKELNA